MWDGMGQEKFEKKEKHHRRRGYATVVGYQLRTRCSHEHPAKQPEPRGRASVCDMQIEPHVEPKKDHWQRAKIRRHDRHTSVHCKQIGRCEARAEQAQYRGYSDRD